MTENCRVCPARLLGDAADLLGPSVDELLPPAAWEHLRAAQRELLLALSITLEHHLRERPAGGDDDTTAARRRRRRPVKVDLE